LDEPSYGSISKEETPTINREGSSIKIKTQKEARFIVFTGAPLN